MRVDSSRTYIRKLCAVSNTRDSLALQRDLVGMLSGADLQPSGLSPAAILCVRSLRDPLPRMVRRRQREMRLPPVWEQTVRATLDGLARTAARPAREAVPANAQAVVFADRAELLACLARDWCEGRIAARWWWRSLVNGTDLNDGVLRAWRETPTYVPAALEVLAEQKRAVAFIRSLPTAAVKDWLQALAYTFGLQELNAVFSSLMPGSITQRVDGSQSVTPRDAHLTQHLGPGSQPPARPPWQRWAPEAIDPELTCEQQCLLGIGLMLPRAPLVVRSSSFAQSIHHWTHPESLRPAIRDDDTLVDVPILPGFAQAPVSQGETTGAAHLSSSPLPLEKLLGGLPQPDSGSSTLSARTERQSQIKGSEPEQQATEVFAAAPVALTPESTGAVIHRVRDEEHLPAREPAQSSEVLSLEQANAATRRESREIETAFGGVFYLVNLGLFLGLYSDFTSPLRPGISLPLWDFVALVGRELVGSPLEDDPVWLLLADLAGRDAGEEPGGGFVPDEQAWRMVSDASLTLSPSTWLRTGLSHEGGGNAITERQGKSEKSDHNTAPLRRWLDGLMPYLRARLQRALALSADDDLAAVLCHHRVRVTTTPTHVDVYLSLAELPIAIRLSGLDRDPGWVPAAGRFIAFHFD